MNEKSSSTSASPASSPRRVSPTSTTRRLSLSALSISFSLGDSGGDNFSSLYSDKLLSSYLVERMESPVVLRPQSLYLEDCTVELGVLLGVGLRLRAKIRSGDLPLLSPCFFFTSRATGGFRPRDCFGRIHMEGSVRTGHQACLDRLCRDLDTSTVFGDQWRPLLYFANIFEQAGVGVLLSNLGIRPDSASLLISGLTTLLMLPSISLTMRLMDVSGRRALLLGTIPILIASLLSLTFVSLVSINSVINASISTVSVILYFCSFVMGFGPIPNILCSEIFPTRVRGACIAINALTFWVCDIIVTYTLPIMLSSIGLAGVFSIYATVCMASWIFVFLQVLRPRACP